MTIVRLHHVQITIPRGPEDIARDFYCRLLGLPELIKPDSLREQGGLWLQVGDRQLHIGTEDEGERRSTKAHVAYEVEDLGAERGLLVEAGIDIKPQIPIPDYDRFEIRDPFGNRIEFLQSLESQ